MTVIPWIHVHCQWYTDRNLPGAFPCVTFLLRELRRILEIIKLWPSDTKQVEFHLFFIKLYFLPSSNCSGSVDLLNEYKKAVPNVSLAVLLKKEGYATRFYVKRKNNNNLKNINQENYFYENDTRFVVCTIFFTIEFTNIIITLNFAILSS